LESINKEKKYMPIAIANRLSEVKEYYFSKKLQEVAALQKAGHDVINLGIGSPDQPPSEQTIERLIASAKQKQNHSYQSYRSVPELRESMASWYQRTYGVTVDPVTEVLPLLGSKEGIMYISMAFLNPGDEVLVPNPGYPAYSAVANLIGAKVRYYDLKDENGWLPDLDSLKKESLDKVKIMWINYPHMPTGTSAPENLFSQLINFAREKQILLCHDNPYSLILNNEPKSIMATEGAKEVCLELNSLSKSHNMAGWRVGMVIGRADYLNAVIQVKSNVDSGMFLPVQHAAAVALNNPPSFYQSINEEYKKRKEIAIKILEALKCTYSKSQTGMFLWAKVPDDVESVEKFADKILNELFVFITPGFIFGSNGNRYIRISLCATLENLNKALNRIVNNLNQ
jgi:LL-diaminopimelate aminotransferase